MPLAANAGQLRMTRLWGILKRPTKIVHLKYERDDNIFYWTWKQKH